MARSGGRTLTKRYSTLLEHYGTKSTQIFPRKANENGVVEQAHRRTKSILAQMLVCGKKNGAAEAVSGKLSGTYYRHASAAPQLVGSVDNVVKGTSGIGSSIFSLAVSGNEIQVRATPGADVTIDWGIVARLAEAKS